MSKKAIVLLSGGLDSSTALYIAKSQGFTPYALSFDYKQRHRHELNCARKIALDAAAFPHRIIQLDLRVFGGSALTSDLAVPKDRALEDMSHDIPITYVPARNTIFLSYALAYAEVLECNDIFIGVNALDYSGYPDCRPEFIEAFARMGQKATKRGVEGEELRIHAPLINMTKAEIIREGMRLRVPYEDTSSCYDPSVSGRPCGACDSCLLRRKGFVDAGFVDPLEYPHGR